VAKAVLPHRMGRMDYRLSGRILTVDARGDILFSAAGPFPLSSIDRVNRRPRWSYVLGSVC